jgi:hypothetical protein
MLPMRRAEREASGYIVGVRCGGVELGECEIVRCLREEEFWRDGL